MTSSYPTGEILALGDVVTRGKSSTLWEVVQIDRPHVEHVTIRLSRLGAYGETNAWTTPADVTFQHRTRFAPRATLGFLMDLQSRVRDCSKHVHDEARYIQRVDRRAVDQADAAARAARELLAGTRQHARELTQHYPEIAEAGQ